MSDVRLESGPITTNVTMMDSGQVTTNVTMIEEPADRLISTTATTLAWLLCLGVAANVVAAPVILFRRTR